MEEIALMEVFCKAMIIFIFAGISIIDCCIMISVSRYNKEIERQSDTNDDQNNHNQDNK